MSEESTTPDLVELMRRSVEAASNEDLDTVMGFFAAEATWDAVGTGVGTFAGVSAIREFMAAWIGAYEEFEIEAEQILDLGNGVTFSLVIQRARLLGSAGYVRRREALVHVWERGAITRITAYLDADEARAAAERLAEERE